MAGGEGSVEPRESPPEPKPEEKLRHVTAGPRAMAELSSLLGLGGWTLEAACAHGAEQVRLAFSRGGTRLVVHLVPKGGPGAFVPGRALSLGSPQTTGPAMRRLLERVAGRLGERALADLAALIDADPGSFAEQRPRGPQGDFLRVPYMGPPVSMAEAGWRNFFADQDFGVLLGVPEARPSRTLDVEYADRECYYSRPDITHHNWSFLDWPIEPHDGGGREREVEEPDRGDSIILELDERDMILGAGAKADAVVDIVRRKAKTADYVLLTHLCTPIVMGEDFSGLARRIEGVRGSATVHWSQKDRDQHDNFGGHFRGLFRRKGFFKGSGNAREVNLYHFPVGYREEELRPMLSELGLEVNVCMFPDVDLPSAERIPAARWQVVCERSFYPEKVRDLLKECPRPVVDVCAPYGLEGTRRCVGAIAEAAGRGREFKKAFQRRLDVVLPAWELLRREAEGKRLAFVVSEATLPMLWGLRYGYGAPLAPMLREMGFGVDLLYYDLHGEPPELPEDRRWVRVTPFRTPRELAKALRGGDFRAVYSDVFFDWRVSAAGKARFGGKGFELGLAGALRSFQRLLALCRLPFYERYGEHLARVPGRLDV